MEKKTIKLRMQSLALEKDVLLKQFNEEREGKTMEELQPFILKLNEYDNRLAECQDWITGLQATVQFPEAPSDMLEKYENSRVATGDTEIAGHARKEVTRKAALDWAEMLDAR